MRGPETPRLLHSTALIYSMSTLPTLHSLATLFVVRSIQLFRVAIDH